MGKPVIISLVYSAIQSFTDDHSLSYQSLTGHTLSQDT